MRDSDVPWVAALQLHPPVNECTEMGFSHAGGIQNHLRKQWQKLYQGEETL